MLADENPNSLMGTYDTCMGIVDDSASCSAPKCSNNI